MTPGSDALLVALVLAPNTYSRNRYFEMFQVGEARRARRRAQIIRSLVRDLTEPWPHPGRIPPSFQATDIRETTHARGIMISYQVPEFQFRRSAVLTPLEAATLRYAVAKTKGESVNDSDRRVVEDALATLDPRQ